MAKSKKKEVEIVKNRKERRTEAAIGRLSTKNLIGKFSIKTKPNHSRSPEQMRNFRRAKNVLKHIRISKAAKGEEAYFHMVKANKLAKKYGYDKK